MPTTTLRILTVRDVDVRVAPSWLLVAAVLVWGYGRSFLDGGRDLPTAAVMGLAVAVGFTASVLLHELAHALEARHRGIEVGGITLFLLGGATALHDPDRRAGDEFAVAGIGPWTNIVLAALLGLASVAATGSGLGPLAHVAGLLGWLNLGLAAFNLVPGAPLDGGRLLRAAVWAVTGDRHRSVVAAAWVGVLLGVGMVGGALWLVGWRGALWPGVWLGLIGAYVLRAARGELARGRLSTWLTTHRVRDMAPPVPLDAVADLPAPPDDAPRLPADAAADHLVGLLDRERPWLFVDGGGEGWWTTLQAVDRRISEVRRGDGPASGGRS